jgi:hypothetical protein
MYRLGDRDRLARPVDDALFFAGEAAHNGEKRERERERERDASH